MLSLEQLAGLLESHQQAASAKVREFPLGRQFFAFNSEPAIMGVVNLSPDSWYRESVCLTAEKAVERGKILQAQGAAMIDVGAESTLAQATRLDQAGQQKKLLPVVKELAAANLIVSVETYQKDVARAGLEAGAKVINLTGMEDSVEIFALAAEFSAAVV